MFESTTQTRTRDAIRTAHAERGQAFVRIIRIFSAR